jgi:hypothetical protein
MPVQCRKRMNEGVFSNEYTDKFSKEDKKIWSNDSRNKNKRLNDTGDRCKMITFSNSAYCYYHD